MKRLTKYICDRAHGAEGVSSENLTGAYRRQLEAMELVEHLAAIEDILGDNYDLERLRELVEADRDGRCVVLPCKPSDVTVYQLRNKKHALGPGVHPRHVYCATVWSGGRYQLEHQGYEPCRDRDFGKAWFLTQEEAALALGAEKNE